MKQSARILSIYAADTAGVCSMLYELGGMTVVHDPSGCNSTYSTHDEPRWYRMDSMIYISALTEHDAVTGNDAKLIDDTVSAVQDLTPKFVALCGSPLPMMVGTDFPALAAEIEARTGVPAFGLHTNGMHSYLTGASEALTALLDRFCRKAVRRTPELSVNLIGATPLDFSLNGSVESMRRILENEGFRVISCMGMGSSLDEIRCAGSAHVNLVVSFCGIAAAELLKQRFGTPYAVGVPAGIEFAHELCEDLRASAKDGAVRMTCADRSPTDSALLGIVGESVYAGSLARAVRRQYGIEARVLCPLEASSNLLNASDVRIPEEDDAMEWFPKFRAVLADPLYAPVCPGGTKFLRMGHEAFSGRCFRKEIPDLMGRKLEWSI